MLYIIGLGLGDEKDITLRGLEAIKKCNTVYMDAYTSLLSLGLSTDGLSALEELYGKQIIPFNQNFFTLDIVAEAKDSDVAFLVVGDPFVGTTHKDLLARALYEGVDFKVVSNASIMSAIGVCGLQLHHFGRTVTIPFLDNTWSPADAWSPKEFYENIKGNRYYGWHTLCFLATELNLYASAREEILNEPPKFMTINTAIEVLLEVEQNRKESVYNEDTTCVGLARVGSEDQKIVLGNMKQLLNVDFGPPVHCLVILGDWSPKEDKMLEMYRV